MPCQAQAGMAITITVTVSDEYKIPVSDEPKVHSGEEPAVVNPSREPPAVAGRTVTMYSVTRSPKHVWHFYADCTHLKDKRVVTTERPVNEENACKRCSARKYKALRALEDLK